MAARLHLSRVLSIGNKRFEHRSGGGSRKSLKENVTMATLSPRLPALLDAAWAPLHVHPTKFPPALPEEP